MVRDRLSSLVHRAVDAAGRVFSPDDTAAVQTLSADLDRLAARLADLEDRLEHVEAPPTDEGPSPLAKLDKRLSMAMGAIQAATTQLMQLKEGVATAQNQAQQAMQRATTAQTTAEAAADGATAAEAQITALIDQVTSPAEE